MEIIPAICERRNGFGYYFIVLSGRGEEKNLVITCPPGRVPQSPLRGCVPKNPLLWYSGRKMLDMAQSVGYNEHVDHSGSAVGMLLVTKVPGF